MNATDIKVDDIESVAQTLDRVGAALIARGCPKTW
jgi:hypothetical protein